MRHGAVAKELCLDIDQVLRVTDARVIGGFDIIHHGARRHVPELGFMPCLRQGAQNTGGRFGIGLARHDIGHPHQVAPRRHRAVGIVQQQLHVMPRLIGGLFVVVIVKPPLIKVQTADI